jgi:methyl-accepting chemotaxis protein
VPVRIVETMSSQDTDPEEGLVASLVPVSIRERFARKFLSTVVVVMLVTAAIGGILFWGVTGALGSQVDERVESTAQLQSDQIENWLEGIERQTRLRAEAPMYQTGSTEEIQLELSAETLEDDIVAVHYLDTRSGEIKASTTAEVRGTNLRQSSVPWASEHFETVSSRTDVGSTVYLADQPYSSPADGSRVIALVTAPSKNTQHLVVVEAAVGSRVSNFQQTSADAYTSIHGTEKLVYDGNGGEASVPATLGDGTNVTTANGEVVGKASVEGTNWTLVSHVPTGSAFAVRNLVGVLTGVLFLVPLLLLGAVAVVVGRRTGSDLQRLTEKAEAMERGTLDIELERQRADEIGRLTAAFDSMREELREKISDAEGARKEAEVARAEAVEMSHHLQRQAETYSETMQKCASGDLTQRMEHDDENDAMDRIACEFNDMIEELEKTTGQLKSYVDEVEESGSEVEESAHTVRQASEQVAESIQKIAIDADDQRDRLQKLSAAFDALAEDLSVAAESDPELSDRLADVQEMVDELRAVADVSEDMQAEADTISAAAEEQAAELTTVSERANDLQRYAKPLRDILGRFETEAEHEFVFSVGPTGGQMSTDAE